MKITKVINASAERVWQILIDTRLWPVWGPSVRVVECSHRFISSGVSGQIQTPVRLWVQFKITGFEELNYWNWKVLGVPATGHRVMRLGDQRCELVFELPMIAFPYALICRLAANRIASLAEKGDMFPAK